MGWRESPGSALHLRESYPPTHTPQSDTWNNLMRRVDIACGLVTTVAGITSGIVGRPGTNAGHSDGLGTAASFNYPTLVALNAAGCFAIIVRRGGTEGSMY